MGVIAPPSAAQWPLRFELALRPESVARWLYARDARLAAPPHAGAEVPLSFLVFLRAQPLLGLSFHQLLDRDPDRGLYGGVGYERHGLLAVGATLQARSEVSAREQVPGAAGLLTVTTLVTRYECAGSLCATESVRMIDLPAASPGTAATAPVQAPRAPGHPRVASVGPVTRSQVAWLTVETGDTNPLHLDAGYAAGRGFPDVVVPATLLSALLERELQDVAGGPAQSFSVRYHAPTHPDQTLQLFASRQGARVDFEAFCGASLRASGKFMTGEPL